jgi:hypothetical protein
MDRDAEAHAQPHGLPSIAFHLKHIARSVDRILTYAEGNSLSGEQLAAFKSEQNCKESLATLLAEVETSLTAEVWQIDHRQSVPDAVELAD